MKHDPVNSPAHYTKGNIECIDAIRASMSDDEFLAWLKGNIIKYLWRWKHKGKPGEDLAKAHFYLNRMIEIQDEREAAVAAATAGFPIRWPDGDDPET